MGWIRVETDHPVAVDSPDHIMPWGTKHDNTTSLEFLKEVEKHYNRFIHFLDLGCAGGQLAVDFLNKGHFSVGLEGSDYNLKTHHPNWMNYHERVLYTCDVSKPFKLWDRWGLMQFDLITAWELIEHIKMEDLPQFIDNVELHLAENGLFVASISTNEDVVNGVRLHQSVFSERKWREEILPDLLTHTDLELIEYPFKHKVREDKGSFHIGLRIKR